MKKTLLLTLAIILIISSTSFALSDIDAHWANPYIDKLIAKAAIAGYPDGTFKPENTISTAEFTKILVATLGHDMGNAATGHWASLYMDKARDLGLIKQSEDEFNAYDAPIDRGMMARLISRALSEQFDDAADYIGQIKDYQMLAANNQLAVLTVYRAGIVTGYPDGSFQDKNSATRAEACTMLARFIEPTLRKVPTPPNEQIDYTGGVDLPSGVSIRERGPNDSPTRYDFYISLNILEPLEPQYRDCEQFLARWFDQSTIDQIMTIVKTKDQREIGFDEYLYYNNKKFNVGSHSYGVIIEIKGFMK